MTKSSLYLSDKDHQACDDGSMANLKIFNGLIFNANSKNLQIFNNLY